MRRVVRVSVAKRQWERTFDAISEPLMIVDEVRDRGYWHATARADGAA